MVVEVQPAIKGAVACGFAAVGTDVGPLVEEGAVEAFDFAVGGGPVGACEGVLDVAERGVELPAAVAAAVIGDGAPTYAVPTAGWDAPELLDVDVHELAGTDGVDPSDHTPGGPVDPSDPIETEANEYTVHGRGGHRQDAGDAHRSQLAAAAQPLDAPLNTARGLVRTTPRPAGTVLETGPPVHPKAGPPLVGGRSRDPHLGRDVRDGTSNLDPFDECVSTNWRQPGVTVHESLPGVRGCLDSSTLPRRLVSFADPGRLNNVRGYYI